MLEQLVADLVQIIRQDPKTGVTCIAVVPFVRTSVQPMMFQAVNVRFHGVMLASQGLKTPAALPFLFHSVAFTPLGHDHLGDVEFEQLAVFNRR